MVVPTKLEQAMETIMFSFHNYSGDKGYMNKDDLKHFMEKEFTEFIKNQKDPMAVDKIMKDLDQCREGQINFQSFYSLIAGLNIACNDYYVAHMKPKSRS